MHSYVITSSASGKVEVKDLNDKIMGHIPSDWIFTVGKEFEYNDKTSINAISFQLISKKYLKQEYSIQSKGERVGTVQCQFFSYDIELYENLKICVNIENPIFSFIPKISCDKNEIVDIEHSDRTIEIQIMKPKYERFLLATFSLILKHELNKK